MPIVIILSGRHLGKWGEKDGDNRLKIGSVFTAILLQLIGIFSKHSNSVTKMAIEDGYNEMNIVVKNMDNLKTF